MSELKKRSAKKESYVVEKVKNEPDSVLSRVNIAVDELIEAANKIRHRQEALGNRIFGEGDDCEKSQVKECRSGMIGSVFDKLDALRDVLVDMGSKCSRLEELA
jgi:hypothetical protein